jgi:hypothetical protein
VAARTEDLEHAARALRRAAAELADVAGDLVGVASSHGLLATAILAPLTLARAEGALAVAVAGPHGVVVTGVRLELLAVRLQGAALGYAGAEAAAGGAVQAVGPVVVDLAALAVPVPVPRQWPRTGGRLLEPIVGALPFALGRVSGALPRPRGDVPAVAALLAAAGRAGPLLHESGTADVQAGPAVPSAPPSGVADLLARVTSCYPEAGAAPGTVRVEGVRGRDGHRAWIVEIPGVQSWSPVPGADPADVTAAVATLGRATTAAAATVGRALELAGASASEPVLLAGHSLGGMLAAALASDASFSRRFRVTHVVAAGSPLAGYRVRPGVAVLALEHDDDLVPALDGAPDPDRPDWVTVRRRPVHGRSPSAAHDVGAYVDTARLVDGSGDPSLQRWLEGLRPFLAAPGVTGTTVAVVGRRVP